MIDPSFLLAAGSIIGLYLVTRNPILGWSWCALMEVPWSYYAYRIGVDAGYGLLVLCLFYLAVYLVNLRKEVKNRG